MEKSKNPTETRQEDGTTASLTVPTDGDNEKSTIEKPDLLLLELAEISGQMVRLGNQLLGKTAVGMYHTFVHDSTIGADCNYALKAQKMFWTKQQASIFDQLAKLHKQIGDVLEKADKNGRQAPRTD